MRLIFVRHGHTVWNGENRYQGHSDSELSELGVLQATRVGGRLSGETISAIYSSDLKRATDTAGAITAHHGLAVVTDSRLRECGFGDWEGLTVTQIEERYPELYAAYRGDSITHRAPNGERLEHLQGRVVDAVNEIAANHPSGAVVVVTHGGPIRAFFCHAFGAGLVSFRKISLHNCGITTFRCDDPGRWLLEALNDTCHLQDRRMGGSPLVDMGIQVESR